MHAGNAPFSQSEGDAGILKPVGVREKHKVMGGGGAESMALASPLVVR